MIDIRRHSLGEALPAMSMVTLQGLSGSGKGECGIAIRDAAVYEGLDARLFDNGLQWRILGYHADGVDLEDQNAIEAYLRREETRLLAAETLGHTATMSNAEIKRVFRTPEMSKASAAIARHPKSQDLARAVVIDRVKQAADDGADLFILDGRATHEYGEEVQEFGLALHAIDWHISADPAVSAAWSLGDLRNTDEMSDNELRTWAKRVEEIDNRNKVDAKRTTYRQLPADAACNSVDMARIHVNDFRSIEKMNNRQVRIWAEHVQQFNSINKVMARNGEVQSPLLRPGVRLNLASGLPEDRIERETRLGQIAKIGSAVINSGHTNNVTEMTRPVVSVTMHALEYAKRLRIIHDESRKWVRDIVETFVESFAA
jgi:cytidylate kinase